MIRDGRNGVTVDTNEPRLPNGAGPVERAFASPLRMADIAAERAVFDRAATAPTPAAAHAGPTGHWARKRAEKLPAIAAALRETTTYAAAAEHLGMTREALSQIVRQLRVEGALPADVDELIRARASKQAAPQRSSAPALTTDSQAPEASVPATDADELGSTATGPAAEQVATPPAPTPFEGEDRCSYGSWLSLNVVVVCDLSSAHGGAHRGRLVKLGAVAETFRVIGHASVWS